MSGASASAGRQRTAAQSATRRRRPRPMAELQQLGGLSTQGEQSSFERAVVHNEKGFQHVFNTTRDAYQRQLSSSSLLQLLVIELAAGLVGWSKRRKGGGVRIIRDCSFRKTRAGRARNPLSPKLEHAKLAAIVASVPAIGASEHARIQRLPPAASTPSASYQNRAVHTESTIQKALR